MRALRRCIGTGMVGALVVAAGGLGPVALAGAAPNLIVNGSFELPNVPTPGLVIAPSIPGWSHQARPGTTSSGIEIQDHVAGAPAAGAGDQFVELDSDGPSRIFRTSPRAPDRPTGSRSSTRRARAPQPRRTPSGSRQGRRAPSSDRWPALRRRSGRPGRSPSSRPRRRAASSTSTWGRSRPPAGSALTSISSASSSSTALPPAEPSRPVAPRCGRPTTSCARSRSPGRPIPTAIRSPLTITGVTQDEPVNGAVTGTRHRTTCSGRLRIRSGCVPSAPVAATGACTRSPTSRRIRAAPSCSGSVTVSVPHDRRGQSVDSGPQTVTAPAKDAPGHGKKAKGRGPR